MSTSSDYEFHMERLTRAAVNGNETVLTGLSTRELRMVFANRAAWARLMLGLAVKLEAGVKQNAVTSHAK